MTRLSKPDPALAWPESGVGLMVLGIGDKPWPARVRQRVADRLTVAGEGLARHAGRHATMVYIVDGAALLLGGQLDGPPDDSGEEIDIVSTGSPRIVERRGARRVALRTIVRIDSGDFEDPVFGVSENFSATGVSVLSRRPLPVNHECELTLTLPSGAVLTTGAHVVHSQRVPERTVYRTALMFAELRERGAMSEGEQTTLREALEAEPREETRPRSRVQSSYQRGLLDARGAAATRRKR